VSSNWWKKDQRDLRKHVNPRSRLTVVHPFKYQINIGSFVEDQRLVTVLLDFGSNFRLGENFVAAVV